jgi:Rrf2 family iron-sulfur cluster assembly transcriptional regulator
MGVRRRPFQAGRPTIDRFPTEVLEGAKMRIDTKGRVAIAALLDIALHGMNEPVPLAEIGKRQGVSVSYLEHLFKRLRQNGFVASFRGPGGGYQLKRQLAAVSVADVICAVDSESFEAIPSAPSIVESATDVLWRKVDDELRNYLRSVTLDAVLADARKTLELRKEAAEATATYLELAPLWLENRPRVTPRQVAATG